jgi:hypothetical protein
MTIINIYSSNTFYRQDYVDENDPILEELAIARAILHHNGYEPIPVRGKGGSKTDKRAINVGWASGEMTVERICNETLFSTAKLNTGLRCGRTVGVDNDLRNPEHAALVQEIVEHRLGPTPLRRRGSKGAMSLYRNETPIPLLVIADANGTTLFEILGTGKQLVAFGKHPDGMDYTWLEEGKNPFTVALAHLPEVTPEQLRALIIDVTDLLIALGYDIIRKDEPRKERQPSALPRIYDRENEDTLELCRAALQALPNNVGYRDWIKICFAVRAAGLDFRDWEEWCHKWHGMNTRAAIERAWHSCNNPRDVTHATLLKWADECDPDWRREYYEAKERKKYARFREHQRETAQMIINIMKGQKQI